MFTHVQTNICRLFRLVVVAVITGIPVSAQQSAVALSTPTYAVWTPEQLSKPGSLGSFGTHTVSIQRRDENAAPEIHPGFSHILMFTGMSGQGNAQGNLILGGEIVDGPDGKKIIRGGTTHKIGPGIVYHIPMNVAHWPKPDPGNVVTYLVANINIAKP